MCGGGGDAQAAAERTERERQGRISANVSNINSAYAGRDPQYQDFVGALREKYNTDLGRQQTDAARQLKFSLAGSGLTGGSQAIAEGRNLSRTAAQGSVDAEQRAQENLAKLKSSDQQSRLGLISLAQTGNDIGNAATQTAEALRSNIEGARAGGLTQGLGDVFGSSLDAVKKRRQAQENRRQFETAYSAPFSRGSTPGG